MYRLDMQIRRITLFFNGDVVVTTLPPSEGFYAPDQNVEPLTELNYQTSDDMVWFEYLIDCLYALAIDLKEDGNHRTHRNLNREFIQRKSTKVIGDIDESLVEFCQRRNIEITEDLTIYGYDRFFHATLT